MEGMFNWSEVPEVDPLELERWMNSTDKPERAFPLAIALQIHDELEYLLMGPSKLDGMQMSEIRGGMKALRRFAQVYSNSTGTSVITGEERT